MYKRGGKDKNNSVIYMMDSQITFLFSSQNPSIFEKFDIYMKLCWGIETKYMNYLHTLKQNTYEHLDKCESENKITIIKLLKLLHSYYSHSFNIYRKMIATIKTRLLT